MNKSISLSRMKSMKEENNLKRKKKEKEGKRKE